MPIYAPAASFIRHAVSLDERRLKFRPALFNHDDERMDQTHTRTIDIKVPSPPPFPFHSSHTHSSQEVWFPGNHGDIGGGWEAEDKDRDVQLSDIALEWMLEELQNLQDPQEEKIKFNKDRLEKFQEKVKEGREHAITNSTCHDALSFRKGWSWLQVIFWWIFGKSSPSHPSCLDEN